MPPATDDYTICIDQEAETDFESDYNVVMEYFGLDEGAQTLTFAQWQARGYDGNSLQASDTDLFTDPGNDDYTLKSTSPAKDAGTTRSEVTDDIVGTARPQGSAYDMGCYEYVEGIPDLVITTSSLADGTVGVGYSETLQATGGV
ncbi:MAG: choice-of-anchor Q domain-containing protein, partial [Planctomycetota bacterium]